EIDISRSHLNQDLRQDNSNRVERVNERLEDVYCRNRKDVKALGTWIVTVPDELKDVSHDKQQECFNEAKNFLDARYGKENAVAAIV
ncbi:plasmid recombination protein, partial [Enterococcus faecalis]|uniref:plasmid recombination protein n=1 Tax=Enterococcus faecalis TaxID=1351 RepID=UPI0021C09230